MQLDTDSGNVGVFLIARSNERLQTPEVVQCGCNGRDGSMESEGPKPLPLRGGCLGVSRCPRVQDDDGGEELLASTQQGYCDPSRDDWLGVLWLGMNVEHHKPDEDMVSSPQQSFGRGY